jgi:hypothetical protein
MRTSDGKNPGENNFQVPGSRMPRFRVLDYVAVRLVRRRAPARHENNGSVAGWNNMLDRSK